MSEELIPCFSCGGEAAWCGTFMALDDDFDWKHHCHQIACKKCGIQFDVVNKDTLAVDNVKDLRIIIAKAWNLRHEPISR